MREAWDAKNCEFFYKPRGFVFGEDSGVQVIFIGKKQFALPVESCGGGSKAWIPAFAGMTAQDKEFVREMGEV